MNQEDFTRNLPTANEAFGSTFNNDPEDDSDVPF
jgi:replicative DNA helicase